MSNDNDTDERDTRELTFVEAVGEATMIGTALERGIALAWLRKTAAKFLFADELDPELREYGTSVLEMVADAIEDEEHWQALEQGPETLQ